MNRQAGLSIEQACRILATDKADALMMVSAGNGRFWVVPKRPLQP